MVIVNKKLECYNGSNQAAFQSIAKIKWSRHPRRLRVCLARQGLQPDIIG